MDNKELAKAQSSVKYKKLGHCLGFIGSNLALIVFAVIGDKFFYISL